MEIFKANAEKKLLENLQQLSNQQTSSRCLHLKCSNLDEQSKELFPDLIKEITSKFDDNESKFFICHDNDVFIINNTFTNRKAAQIIDHVQAAIPPLSEYIQHIKNDFIALFEINIDWAKLRDICTYKIAQYELYLKKLHKKKMLEEGRDVLNEASAEATQKLLQTLTMRRNERINTEILVIEDDLFSQKLVKSAIGQDHNVSLSNTGKQGLKDYLHTAPDILFLDINIPDLTGHDVLKKVLNIDPDAYVVMLSGNGDKENIVKAI